MGNPSNDGSDQQMRGRQNYNLHSSSSSVVTVQKAIASEDEVITASSIKLEKFRGVGTDDIEEFIKKFDRYVNVINAKMSRKWTFCAFIWKGVPVGLLTT